LGQVSKSGPRGKKKISDFDNQFPNNAEVERNSGKILRSFRKNVIFFGGTLRHLEQLWYATL
jgi:hypothetical protein